MKQLFRFSFMLLALLLSATATAHDFEVDGIYYNINGTNTAKVTCRGTGYWDYNNEYSGSVTIPETVIYNSTTYSVTAISNSAFRDCSGLTSVNIPNSVTEIGSGAFSYCSGLTSVNNGNSVTAIGDYAFSCCSGLTSITIPNSVTTIGDYAFTSCSGLTSITIPNSVTTISPGAFSDCSGLTSITIPNSVMTIGDLAFYGCSGLTNITIPNSVTTIGDYAFQGCSALDVVNFNAVSCADFIYSYYVSHEHDPYGDTYYPHPFYNLNISTIVIGNEVQRIPNNFSNNLHNLTDITIGNSVTTIGERAFYECRGLTSVTIPNSVTTIGNSAFYGCEGLTSITIPNTVSTIGDYAFSGCSGLTNIDIPNSVTTIGNSAFSGCSGLTSATIGNSVTEIGNSAFFGCSGLTSITVAYDNTKYDSRDNCNAIIETSTNKLIKGCKTTIIPNSVTEIGNSAFAYCSGLTSVTIPNSVTTIGNSAFAYCSGLTSIDIPNSVTTIGNDVFWLCSGLTSATIGYSVTTIGRNAFHGCTSLDTLNFNAVNCADLSSIASYHPFDDSNISTIIIGDSVQRIPAYFAYGFTQLSSIKFPSTVTFVGKQAFNNCPAIGSVTCAATTPPAWNDIAMFTTNVYNHSPLYVPTGSESAYMADQCWGQFANIIGKGVSATGISLNHSHENMIVGGSLQLIATVLPDSASVKQVVWTSSDPSVASVDENGLVTAHAVGGATITATTTDGTDLSASCGVTVNEDLSNYDNYLLPNDATAFHGSMIVIPVKMTNAVSIISFQTDIFLPEGLELLKEDGEYIIDPSERMTRTHSIMSNDVSNGAVRVICYSSNYKPFTGSSGDDLFYITVKVADDAEGNYTIVLRNTLLTNTSFVDLTAPDVASNVNVAAYVLGDANNSGMVTITDVVVTAQYVLEMNPQPFVFRAADVNLDGAITVADVSRIAWMVLNPDEAKAPLRAPALWNNGDRMSGEGVSLMAGETRTVSITLDNEMDYTAFQMDLALPEGLTASNFQLTERVGSHAFDINTLANGKTRALCYSPALNTIHGHEGALLTFDVTAAGALNGDITVDGIELVTTGCQSVKLDAFTIGVNNASSINESITGKAIAKVEYFNLAGQRMEQPSAGVTLVVTTYTDGSRTTTKIFN